MKNIEQLKEIRIYCLAIPYQLKFASEHLIGLKLAYLKLVGTKGIEQRNKNILDANLIIMVNNCKTLTQISVGCIG